MREMNGYVFVFRKNRVFMAIDTGKTERHVKYGSYPSLFNDADFDCFVKLIKNDLKTVVTRLKMFIKK